MNTLSTGPVIHTHAARSPMNPNVFTHSFMEGQLGLGRPQARDSTLEHRDHALPTENQMNWENRQKSSVYISPQSPLGLLLWPGPNQKAKS